MEVDVASPLQLRNYLSRIVLFFPFPLNGCIMCDYNNTSAHKMGTWDCAVKNQGCGHLFKVTGLHPSDRVLIGHSCFMCSQFLWPLSSEEWEITACTAKAFPICLFPAIKKKLQIMLFKINPTNKNEYSGEDWNNIHSCVNWVHLFPAIFYVIFLQRPWSMTSTA